MIYMKNDNDKDVKFWITEIIQIEYIIWEWVSWLYDGSRFKGHTFLEVKQVLLHDIYEKW
jgi:hypothetical protein